MKAPPGMVGDPGKHLWTLVGGIVVHDQMDVEVLGHGVFNALEKAEKLLMPVPRPALSEDGSGGDIEGRKERGGVPPGGLLFRVRWSSSATFSSGTERGRPGRSSS